MSDVRGRLYMSQIAYSFECTLNAIEEYIDETHALKVCVSKMASDFGRDNRRFYLALPISSTTYGYIRAFSLTCAVFPSVCVSP